MLEEMMSHSIPRKVGNFLVYFFSASTWIYRLGYRSGRINQRILISGEQIIDVSSVQGYEKANTNTNTLMPAKQLSKIITSPERTWKQTNVSLVAVTKEHLKLTRQPGGRRRNKGRWNTAGFVHHWTSRKVFCGWRRKDRSLGRAGTKGRGGGLGTVP